MFTSAIRYSETLTARELRGMIGGSTVVQSDDCRFQSGEALPTTRQAASVERWAVGAALCIYKSLKCYGTLPFAPFSLPEAALRSNLPSTPLSHGKDSATGVLGRLSALMTGISGFPDRVGTCTFLYRDPGPSFHRRELHPAGLGMGE